MRKYLEVVGWTYRTNPDYPTFEAKTKKKALAVRLVIIEELLTKGYFFSGNDHDSTLVKNACVPVLNTGEKVLYEYDEWGAIIAELCCLDNTYGTAYLNGAFFSEENKAKRVFPRARVERKKIIKKEEVIFPPVPSGYRPYGTKKNMTKAQKIIDIDYTNYLFGFFNPKRQEKYVLPKIFTMNLEKDYFQKIKKGEKTIEIRLFDEKRQQIEVGDYIDFYLRPKLEETVSAKVINLYRADFFEELFMNIEFEKCGLGEDVFLGLDLIYKFYSIEDEKKYGVLAIEFELV